MTSDVRHDEVRYECTTSPFPYRSLLCVMMSLSPVLAARVCFWPATFFPMPPLIEGKNVSFFPSYGVEKRGGAAMCTVVIADGEVGSPVVGAPSVSVFLNQTSLDKFGAKTKTGGSCIINSSLVDISRFNRRDIEIILLPMNEIAMELGDPRMVNMVAVGRLCGTDKSRGHIVHWLKR